MEGTTTMQGRIPILPRHGFFLEPTSHGCEARFAALFRCTWKRIPPRCRNTLLAYWKHDPWKPASLRSPLIAIEPPSKPSSSPGSPSRPMRYVLATCKRAGHEFQFHPAVVDRMPDAHVAELVAHELAHAWLEAIGASRRGAKGEIRADRVMKRWGFDPFAGCNWYHTHARGWSMRAGPIWRHTPARPEELGMLLWEPQFPSWHVRYLDSKGRKVWDDWRMPK